MLMDIEQLAARPLRSAEPANRPTRGWLRRKVEKMALLEGRTLSQTAKTKAMSWLLQRILTQQPGTPIRMHSKLSPSMVNLMERLEQKAQRTIEKIRSGSFCPKKFLSKSGTNRAFSILPQFSLETRYLPVDNHVLRELLSTLWRRGYHPFHTNSRNLQGKGYPWRQKRQEFDSHMQNGGVASFVFIEYRESRFLESRLS
ncbi:hypothetical protein V1524DRAFT_119321 [Lipomyces starkeyi]